MDRGARSDSEVEITPLLSVKDLELGYRRSAWRAPEPIVKGVSFEIGPGQTLGLAGESGSGKTTIGRAILGLIPVEHGEIRFEGELISDVSRRRRRALTAYIQMIFQDPYSSLNPARTVAQTLAEPLLAHGKPSKEELSRNITSSLEKVGLPHDAARRYPHQFSGGQRQRIAIARALIVQPRLLVCDEPVSSLDLSMQAQVLNLLRDLQGELTLSYLFVSHDLGVLRYMADDLAILQHGQLVEIGEAEQVLEHPQHPYTKELLAARPSRAGAAPPRQVVEAKG